MSGVLRRGRVIGAALVVVLAATLSGPTAATAATAEESLLLTLTNTARAAVGAPALVLDGPLSSIARRWATSMAAQNNISHNPNLKDQIEAAGYSNWTKTGENVGMGPTVQIIHNALLASPGHYRNIADPAFQRAGIGIVVANGTVWVVVNFLTLGAAPAPPPPPPAPAPTVETAAAAPAPTPAPPTRAPVATTAPPPPTPTTTTTAPPPPPTTAAPTTAPPAPTTALPPPSSGLPLQLALMLQQLKGLSAPR